MAKQRLNNGGPIKKWKAPRTSAPAAPRTDTHPLSDAGVSPAEAARRLREMEQGTHSQDQVLAHHKNVNKSRIGED